VSGDFFSRRADQLAANFTYCNSLFDFASNFGGQRTAMPGVLDDATILAEISLSNILDLI